MAAVETTLISAGTATVTPSRRLDLRPQLWCAYTGFIFPFLVLIALFGAGVLPPQSPNHTADALAAWFQHHHTFKLAGFATAAVALGLFIPLTIAMTLQLIRIE